MDSTRVQLLSDAERLKPKCNEYTISSLQTVVKDLVIWPIELGKIYILPCVVDMSRACRPSWHKLLDALMALVWHSILSLTSNLGKLSQLCNRVCTLIWQVSMVAWKTFVVMMHLLILRTVIYSLLIHSSAVNVFHRCSRDCRSVSSYAPSLVRCM